MRLRIRKPPVAIPFGIVAGILWTQVLGGILEDDWQKAVAFTLIASLLSMAFWRLQFRSPIWMEFRGEELQVGLQRRSYRVHWQEIDDVAHGDYRGSLVSYTVFVRGGRTFTLAEADAAVLIEWLSKHQQGAAEGGAREAAVEVTAESKPTDPEARRQAMSAGRRKAR